MTKLWGGRFAKKTNQLVEDFTRSIHYDQKLAQYDCIGSLYHINILKSAGLLSAKEHAKLKKGLKKIMMSIDRGSFQTGHPFEDIHSCIQQHLEKDKQVGQAAAKLHACRSRNEQVVFDTKCYCQVHIPLTMGLLLELDESLQNLTKKNRHLQIPGFTHLQHAIPVSLSDYLLAYAAMLERDVERLNHIFTTLNFTMGAGSLAGTIIAAPKYKQAIKSVFPGQIEPGQNSIDAVSDRDFVIESLSALAILQMHLSRMAEDMILWATKEFDFIDIDEAFCTGSSLMPQKKNPDVLELVRGYTGRLTGNLVNVLTMMKGLPLSYNRDMQLDKEPLFDSFEIIQKELAILAELFKNITFKETTINKQLADESLYATDLADYLVQHKVPFKAAHAAIGKLIQYKYKGKKEIQLRDLDDATLKKFHPLLNARLLKKIMNPRTSVETKKSVRRKRPQ